MFKVFLAVILSLIFLSFVAAVLYYAVDIVTFITETVQVIWNTVVES